MKKSELRQLIREEIEKNKDNNLKDIKKIITSVFRKMGYEQIKSQSTSVRGFSRSEQDKGYRHEKGGSVYMKGFNEEEKIKIFNELNKVGVDILRKYTNGFDYSYTI